MTITDAAAALLDLERVVAAVKGEETPGSKFARAVATLKLLSRKEGMAMTIVGGLAGIHHGYENRNAQAFQARCNASCEPMIPAVTCWSVEPFIMVATQASRPVLSAERPK